MTTYNIFAERESARILIGTGYSLEEAKDLVYTVEGIFEGHDFITVDETGRCYMLVSDWEEIT